MATYIFAGASSAMAQAAAKMLRSDNHTIIGISTKTDVPGYDQLLTVADYHSGTYPALDIAADGLAYFPGSINLKPFRRTSLAEMQQDFQLHTLGAAAFVQAYLPHLQKGSNASVVFISSAASALGLPFHASVSMAKGALEGLTRALAAELAPVIRVNAIAPSLTDTPLAGKLLNTPEKTEASAKRNPLQKVGSATDIAEAISYLLSPRSAWVTGQVLHIDGGFSTLKL